MGVAHAALPVAQRACNYGKYTGGTSLKWPVRVEVSDAETPQEGKAWRYGKGCMEELWGRGSAKNYEGGILWRTPVLGGGWCEYDNGSAVVMQDALAVHERVRWWRQRLP